MVVTIMEDIVKNVSKIIYIFQSVVSALTSKQGVLDKFAGAHFVPITVHLYGLKSMQNSAGSMNIMFKILLQR